MITKGQIKVIVRPEEHNEKELDSVQLNIMNTSFYMAVSNDNRTEWKKSVLSFLQYIEQDFSRFHSDNELSRFNEAKRDSTICVSPVLYDILKKAEEYRLKTEGRFSSYMLTQLEAHGYNQSFPFITANNEATTLYYQSERQPLIFKEDGQIIKKTDQKIDLGGIAKGYAVEAVSKWLQNHTHCKYGMIDGGGDMAMWSNGDKTWKIGVRDPFNQENEVGSFSIQNGGIATSNIIYRNWIQGDTKKHHLLDGRTGMPTATDVVQATVVTEHCLDAEISAKICFMDNSRTVKKVLSNISSKFSYVLVKSNGEVESGGSKNEL